MLNYTLTKIHDPAAKECVTVYLVDFEICDKRGQVTAYVDEESRTLNYDSSGLSDWEDDEIFSALSLDLL